MTPYYRRSSKEGFRERKPLEGHLDALMQDDKESVIDYAKLKQKAQ